MKYLCILLLSFVALGSHAKDGKMIFLDKDFVNVGILPAKRRDVKAMFYLYNKTGKSLSITKHYTECGCTSVYYKHKIVKKRSKIKICVSVDIRHKRGKFEEKVLLRLSNGEHLWMCVKGIKDIY